MQSLFLHGILSVLLFGFATASSGIVGTPIHQQDNQANHILDGTSERANADIQIRRIRTMISEKTIDVDEAYERLEALQVKKK